MSAALLPATTTVCRTIALLALGLTMLLVPGCGDDREKQAIQETWNKFATASVNKDPADFASMLSTNSLTYYEQLLPLARSGTRAQITSLPLMERLDVIMMRNRCTGEELKKLTAAFWIKKAMEKGEIFDFGGWDLENPKIKGDFAICQVLVDGEPIMITRTGERVTFEFVKEASGWKFDLVASSKMISEILIYYVDRRQVDPQNFIITLEQSLSGNRPRADIFDTPNS
jgi:hypothetical protein